MIAAFSWFKLQLSSISSSVWSSVSDNISGSSQAHLRKCSRALTHTMKSLNSPEPELNPEPNIIQSQLNDPPKKGNKEYFFQHQKKKKERKKERKINGRGGGKRRKREKQRKREWMKNQNVKPLMNQLNWPMGKPRAHNRLAFFQILLFSNQICFFQYTNPEFFYPYSGHMVVERAIDKQI